MVSQLSASRTCNSIVMLHLQPLLNLFTRTHVGNMQNQRPSVPAQRGREREPDKRAPLWGWPTGRGSLTPNPQQASKRERERDPFHQFRSEPHSKKQCRAELRDQCACRGNARALPLAVCKKKTKKRRSVPRHHDR